MWHTIIDEGVSCAGQGKRYRRVAVVHQADGTAYAGWPGAQGPVTPVSPQRPRGTRARRGPPAGDAVMAPMAARVLAIHVQPGDSTTVGQALVVLEAMKMEHTIVAQQARQVATVTVGAGSQVSQGQTLVTFMSQEGAPS